PGIVVLLRRCLDKDRNRRLRDVADIRIWIDEALASPAGAGSSTTSRPKGSSRAIGILGAAAAIIIAALGVPAARYFRQTPPNVSVTRFEITTPPTAQSYTFALSPDGRQLVFPASGQLWLRPLDNVAARPLTGTQGASAPFWSPDSRSVAFFADNKLKRIE